MTGTADTEAQEFHDIYKLDVVAIPTNKQVCRDDFDDVVYLSQKDKWNAIVDEIKAFHDARAADPGGHDQRREEREAQQDADRAHGVRTRCSTPSSTSARRSSSRTRASSAR